MTSSPLAPTSASGPAAVPPVVVGFTDHQADRVVETAADFAALLRVPLVLVAADATRIALRDDRDGADGPLRTVAVDPDEQDDEAVTSLRAALEERVARLRRERDLDPVIRLLPGEPADVLGRVAAGLGAQLIVVGTADRSFRAGVREFFGGSVATHLAHRQHIPVLVVPTGDEDSRHERSGA